MSEQTPGQAEQDSIVEMGDAEPSMEDILASIRKIIADDVDPVPLDGPSDMTAGPVVDAVPAPVDIAAEDPFDIDALLGDLEPVEVEAPAAALPETSLSDDLSMDALDDVIDLEIPVIPDEPSVSAAAEPVKALGATAAMGLLAASDKPSRVAEVAATSDDDMDGLIDELLADLDMVEDAPAEPVADTPAEPETVIDPAAELLASDPLESDPLDSLLDMDDFDLVDASPEPASELSVPQIQESEDLDLVKSLMEDLTDEDQIDLDAPVVDAEPEMAESGDVLDDILNMTLDDEIDAQADLQPLDIPEMEPEGVAETAPLEDIATVDDAAPSLADIAASAEADAHASRSLAPAAMASAAVAGAALAGGAVAAPETEPVAPVAAEAVNQPEPTTDTTPMETPMPRAVRSEAILDEVTEEATMSAFAELNQVVEEKAVYSERGPRIGDLVSEALKPMLKEWLDANLKGIVERAVAKEVKRISTGK